MTSLKSNFSGLTVVSFESRMSLPIQKLIERHGGKAIVAPSMKEVPLAENRAAFDFFDALKAGQYDLVILMTGIATKTLVETLKTRHPEKEIVKTLSESTKIVVRGPKPTAACRMMNIPIAYTAPEPNTWREIIAILQDANSLSGKRAAVIEYGIPNSSFIEELEAAGAVVTPVKVYSWALPDDLGPLNRAIDAIVNNKVDLALFTTSVQVDHLLEVTQERKLEAPLRRALTRVGICSIGPTTSERLRTHQIFPDLEASPNKMATLVEQAAAKAQKIVKRKRVWASRAWVRVSPEHGSTSSPCPGKGGPMWPPGKGQPHGVAPTKSGHPACPPKRKRRREPVEGRVDSPFLRACRLQKNKTVPIWLMRQAGRYMAEYQAIRKNVSFKEFCKNPDLAAEATITAVERLGVDAAIIFSDILLILEPMGLQLDYQESIGPVIANPVRDAAAVKNLRTADLKESLSFVMEAIKKVRRSMHSRIPLIGFAGAPFTVASYMIEGRGNRQFIATKSLMHSDPKAWNLLLEKITTASIRYLNAQIEAGCDVVQIFDSWVFCLTPDEYRNFVLPHTRRLIRGIRKGTPVIHFGSFYGDLLKIQKEAGGNGASLDWRVDIKQASKLFDKKTALQGNLDPTLLLSPPKIFLKETQRILKSVGSRPGFIFNLGHGILPETPVDNVMALVDFVHKWKI